MELENLVRKYVRMPWEVWKGQEDCRDRDVAKDIAFHCNAGEYFKEEPLPEERKTIIQALAEVMAIAFTKQSGGDLEKRNRFKELPEEDKANIRSYFGIKKPHMSVLRINTDEELIPKIASYVAAAYGLTTWQKPYVTDFDLLAAVAEHSKIERCEQETEMRCAGLLIITDLDLPSRANIDTYAFLLNLLNMRTRKQRMNMFFHPPVGDLQRIYQQGNIPTRLEVVDAYLSAIPARFIIHNSFTGQNVHISDVDKMDMIREQQRKEQENGPQQISNESGETGHEQHRKALIV